MIFVSVAIIKHGMCIFIIYNYSKDLTNHFHDIFTKFDPRSIYVWHFNGCDGAQVFCYDQTKMKKQHKHWENHRQIYANFPMISPSEDDSDTSLFGTKAHNRHIELLAIL